LIYKADYIEDSEKTILDNNLKPIIKRQLLLMGASIGTYLLVSYFFGFLVGFVVNTAMFLGFMFYIRRRQLTALRSFGFSDDRVGIRYTNQERKLRYGCISCGSEVNGLECSSCGSKMKKPLFQNY
jgi:hypothetical protein